MLIINLSQYPTSAPLSFIRRHRDTLTSLCLHITVNDELLDTVVDCPHLTRLNLINPRLTTVHHWKTVFSSLWPHLKSMTFEGLWVFTREDTGLYHCAPYDICGMISSPLTGLPMLSKIRELVFHTHPRNEYVTQSQLLLIKQCPGLVRLHWNNARDFQSVGPAHLLAQTGGIRAPMGTIGNPGLSVSGCFCRGF